MNHPLSVGDKVYSIKDGRYYRIHMFYIESIGDRDVLKIMTTKYTELFYDECIPRRRWSDTFFGRIFSR